MANNSVEIDPQSYTSFCAFASTTFCTKYTTCYGQVTYSVISTAGLSKFNIIPKAFIPDTTSILLFQKATKR
jgi:hypothetical protein